MPYRSKAQQRKFHADPKLRRYAAEFDAATNFANLPARASEQGSQNEGKAKMAGKLINFGSKKAPPFKSAQASKTTPSTTKSVNKTAPALHTTDSAPPGNAAYGLGPLPGNAAVRRQHETHLNVPGRHAHLRGGGS